MWESIPQKFTVLKQDLLLGNIWQNYKFLVFKAMVAMKKEYCKLKSILKKILHGSQLWSNLEKYLKGEGTQDIFKAKSKQMLKPKKQPQ